MPKSSSSKSAAKVSKPHPNFPLFPHATGRWCKKIRGKFHYFGKTADDPKGQAALDLWLDVKDDLLAGRTPRPQRDDGLKLRELCNTFLTAKQRQLDSGDIVRRTFDDYFATCRILIDGFGKDRYVDDLRADDFERLRTSLAGRLGVVALGNTVNRIRGVFKFADEVDLIDRPVKFGPHFKRPSAKLQRQARAAGGLKMFEADEIKTLLDAAGQPLRAMILLGANCGFGNSDSGQLTKKALDLKSGWVNFPRPKTGIDRRCPLWPETVEALREAIKLRPKHKLPANAGLVFITKQGHSFFKATPDGPISKEFRKLTGATGLHRRGRGFYALRHTFETIGGESADQVAVNYLMGHVDSSMAGRYRERISDTRLLAVSDSVRAWLFGGEA